MADLPAGHRHQPTDQGGHGRILEHHGIGGEEAYRAHQMERLVHPAVMIVAMVVPTLHSQSFEKAVHVASLYGSHPSLPWRFDESHPSSLCRFDESGVTGEGAARAGRSPARERTIKPR